MAGVLNKDPFTYQQEHKEFLEELERFHVIRGTPFTRIPRIGGKDVDLYLLYRRVIGFGGWRKVNESEDLWDQIIPDFHLPKGCSNSTQAIKHIYIRFLDKYEKIHFHGEDPNSKDGEDDPDTPARKKICLPLFGIPLSYNYNQHRVSESTRQNLGFSGDKVSLSDYDKLEKSLLSGLPNEVDFVINVCTLLSNEGKHVLRLERSNLLLSLLMAHVGVFEEGPRSFEEVYESGWKRFLQRDFIHFWYDTVRKDKFEKLIYSSRDYIRKPLIGQEVLHLGRDSGKHDLEGQRVLQLAIIIRNLSFEDDNALYMSKNKLVFRFLLLCINSSYGCLRPLALDTLGNLAEKIVLSQDDTSSDMILDLISRCLAADDKLDVVRGLEILSKLCQKEENDTALEDSLDDCIYEDIVRLLGVYDIQIIVHSLEALYQLSELGEHTATKIAAVKFAVDVLVNLLTIEAQSYGPNSLIGIKVVEYCPPPQPNTHQGEQPSPNPPAASQALPTPTKQPAPQTVSAKQVSAPINCDVESTTCNWLQSTFESRDNSSSISQLMLYSEYISFSKKYSLPQILPSQTFINCVKVVFPKVEIVNMVKEDGTPEVTYCGIGKRLNALPFSLNSTATKQRSNVHTSAFPQTASPFVDLTQTPTLRQRLMEPPRLSALKASPSLLPIGDNTRTTSAISASLSSLKAQSSITTTSPANQASQRPYPTLQPKQNLVQQTVQPPMINVNSGTSSPSMQSPGGFRSGSVLQQQLASPLQQAGNNQQQGTANQNLPVFIIQSVYPQNEQQPSIAPQSNLSLVVSDVANQKQSQETRMIKTLLAKKLRHNQSGPVPICPKGSIDTGNPMQLLTFTTQQTNVIQGQLQQSYSINNTAVVTAPPVQQFEQFTPIQGQVTFDNSQFYQTQPAASCVPVQPQQTISSHSNKKQKSHPSKTEKSKKKNGSSPSHKPFSSSGAHSSSRSSSPKNLSSSPQRTFSVSSTSSSLSNAHQLSPGTISPNPDLGVCSGVEKAASVVQVGMEASIECIENNSLDQIKNVVSTSACSLPSNSSDCVSDISEAVSSAEILTRSESQVNPVSCGMTITDTGQTNMLAVSTQNPFNIQNSNGIVNDPFTSDSMPLVSSATITTVISALTSDSPLTSTNGQISLQHDQYQNQDLTNGPSPQDQYPIQESPVPSVASSVSDSGIFQTGRMNSEDNVSENSVKECVNNANNNHQSVKSPVTLSEESSREGTCLSAIAGFRERIESEKEENSLDNMESILSSEALRLEGYSSIRDEGLFHSVADSQLIRKIPTGKDIVEKCNNESLMNNDRVKGEFKSSENQQSELSNDIIDEKPLKTTAVLNGGTEYPDEIIPSPTHAGMNGIDSMSEDSCPGKESLDIQKDTEVKECMNKLNEKLKVNGIVKHVIGNGDLIEDNDVLNFEVDEDIMNAEENGEKMMVAADGIKHVVIHAGENDQVVIDSQGRLEINGTVTDMNFSTEEMDNAIDNPEQILAVKSILEPSEEDENEDTYMPTEAECYELAGEPDDIDSQTMEQAEDMSKDEDADAVIIENEMCLKPTPCLAPAAGDGTVQSTIEPEIAKPEEDTPMEHNDVSLNLALEDQDKGEKTEAVMEFTEENSNLEPAGDNEINTRQPALDPIAEIAMKLGIDTEATDSVEDKDEIKEDPLIGHPFVTESMIGQPLVGEPPLACIQFKGIPIMNSNLTYEVDLGSQGILKDDINKSNALVSTIFSVVTSTISNQQNFGGTLGVIQSIEDTKPKGSQGIEICTSSRHMPTPEASRDSELSCDSIASSLTDSSSTTDKHSISISSLIQGIQSAVGKSTASSTASTNTPSSSAKKSRNKSGEKKAKKRSRNTSGSADSRSSTPSIPVTASPVPEYMCEWANCKRCFENSKSVFCHVCSVHLTREAEGVCLWEGCEKLTRKRWSLFTHVQDHHCSENALKAARVRRQQIQQSGGTAAKPHTIPALVYPPDAAWQAIRRFTPKPPYPEFVEQREGPVTKHIRLTAALVLRNLARYSTLGRSLIKPHERHINYTAMSALESSNALANCLWEVLHDH